MKESRLSLLPYLLFGAACLLLPGIFIFHHVTNSSDGVRLDRLTNVYKQEGVVLSPYREGEGPLLHGDILVAISGIRIEERARNFFTGDARSQVDESSTSRVYTVLREGKLLQVEVEPRPFPWQHVLSDHWGVFVFIIAAQGIAVLILLQRKMDLAAQTFFIWAFSGSHIYIWAFWLQPIDLLNGLSYWFFRLVNIPLWLLFWAAMVHLLFVFPKKLLRW
jgi:hypothetical protein